MMKLISSILMLSVATSVAFADDMYGVFMVVKGDVKVKSVKSGKTDAVKIGSKVFPGDTVITAADSRAKIVMSDRNVLAMSPDSNMTIAKYENNAAKGDKNVELSLSQGKVRANVEQKYDSDKNKFMIKSPTAVAGVRGTKFMMGFDPGTQASQVLTFSGQVQFGAPAPGGGMANPVLVNPGQMTTATAGAAPEAPKTIPKEEMKKMDGESSGDTAGGKSGTSDSMMSEGDMSTEVMTGTNASTFGGDGPPKVPPQDTDRPSEWEPNSFLNDAISNGNGGSRVIIVPNMPQ